MCALPHGVFDLLRTERACRRCVGATGVQVVQEVLPASAAYPAGFVVGQPAAVAVGDGRRQTAVVAGVPYCRSYEAKQDEQVGDLPACL